MEHKKKKDFDPSQNTVCMCFMLLEGGKGLVDHFKSMFEALFPSLWGGGGGGITQGHFLTQKESVCQISADSEQLEKSQRSRREVHTPLFHGALQLYHSLLYLLHMSLFEGFDVNVALQALHSYGWLDLQRLQTNKQTHTQTKNIIIIILMLHYYGNIMLNPFTPESDQFQISPAASPEILHHTVRRTWLFIAYSDSHYLTYAFSL